MALELPLDSAARLLENRLDLGLQSFWIVERGSIELHFQVHARAARAVVGLTDFATESHIDVNRYGVLLVVFVCAQRSTRLARSRRFEWNQCQK
jgi:hypothetical protein